MSWKVYVLHNARRLPFQEQNIYLKWREKWSDIQNDYWKINSELVDPEFQIKE